MFILLCHNCNLLIVTIPIYLSVSVLQMPNLQTRCVRSERAMMAALVTLVRRLDPDILVGYEVVKNSWGYLRDRFFAIFPHAPPLETHLSRNLPPANTVFVGAAGSAMDDHDIERGGEGGGGGWRGGVKLVQTKYTLEQICIMKIELGADLPRSLFLAQLDNEGNGPMTSPTRPYNSSNNNNRNTYNNNRNVNNNNHHYSSGSSETKGSIEEGEDESSDNGGFVDVEIELQTLKSLIDANNAGQVRRSVYSGGGMGAGGLTSANDPLRRGAPTVLYPTGRAHKGNKNTGNTNITGNTNVISVLNGDMPTMPGGNSGSGGGTSSSGSGAYTEVGEEVDKLAGWRRYAQRKGLEFQVKGRLTLNVWRLMRHEVKLASYSLRTVAKAVMNRTIPMFTPHTLVTWCARGLSGDISGGVVRAIRHVLRETVASLDALAKVEWLERTVQMARVYGLRLCDVANRYVILI